MSDDKTCDAFDTGFIIKTNTEYAAWCRTYYQADSLDERGMKSLDGLWAWQAATLAAQRQPLTGYQLVPIEPTETMLSVGNVTLICGADEVYRAMLSATPQGNT